MPLHIPPRSFARYACKRVDLGQQPPSTVYLNFLEPHIELLSSCTGCALEPSVKLGGEVAPALDAAPDSVAKDNKSRCRTSAVASHQHRGSVILTYDLVFVYSASGGIIRYSERTGQKSGGIRSDQSARLPVPASAPCQPPRQYRAALNTTTDIATYPRQQRIKWHQR